MNLCNLYILDFVFGCVFIYLFYACSPYACVYVSMFLCVCWSVSMCICVYLCIFICKYEVCIHLSMCMLSVYFICVYVYPIFLYCMCVYVCIYILIYIYIYVCVHICIYILEDSIFSVSEMISASISEIHFVQFLNDLCL